MKKESAMDREDARERKDTDGTGVSARAPDWSRERCGCFEWKPGAQLVRSIRRYQRIRGWPLPFRLVGQPLAVLAYRFWSAVAGADVPLNAELGGGLVLLHPNGIVIHARARLGPNCLLFQQVTIGTDRQGGVPVLGGHVDVGAGAKLIGAIRIGDHALIGANAVVLRDVPEGCVAVGVPARILAKRTEPETRPPAGGPA